MTRPQDVSTSEAASWLEQADAPTVIDVRTPAEFAGPHIAGAVNVPLDMVEGNAQQIAAAADGEVLLVCRTDRRAHRAAELLAPHLGGRVHVLSCGMAQWEQDGRPVEDSGQQIWAMDRQVRTVAGSLVLASILASLGAPKARLLAGGVGAGLLWSGVSDTCAMANVLQKMPWNRQATNPTLAEATQRLAATRKEG